MRSFKHRARVKQAQITGSPEVPEEHRAGIQKDLKVRVEGVEEVGTSYLQGPGTPPAGEAARRPQQRLGEAGLQLLPVPWTGGSHWHLRHC